MQIYEDKSVEAYIRKAGKSNNRESNYRRHRRTGSSRIRHTREESEVIDIEDDGYFSKPADDFIQKAKQKSTLLEISRDSKHSSGRGVNFTSPEQKRKIEPH